MSLFDTRPDFPIAIDSTMRAAFVSCPRKYQLEFLHNRAHPRKSVHLVAGGAYAKGLEVARTAFWQEQLTKEEAWTKGLTAIIRDYENPELYDAENKCLSAVLLAFDDYFLNYGWESDHITPHVKGGRICVENTFALPLEVLHPVTGEPILYTGRFDMIGDYKNQIFVLDDKTTGYLGPQWMKNWVLRAQLTGYFWAARMYGVPVAGVIVRGCAFLKYERKFAESIQYRPDWELERWLIQINRDVTRMIQCWEEGYFDYNLDSSCASYGGCQFMDACKSRDPSRILEQEFVSRAWNPLDVT